MYLWIFLFVLGFAAALYFAWQNRGIGDDEVVLPQGERPKQTTDTEVAEELDAQDLVTGDAEKLRQGLRSGDSDEEVAEEIDFDERVRQIHAEQGLVRSGTLVKEPITGRRKKETSDLNFRKIPIPRNKANDITLELEMMELGIDDSSELITRETKTHDELTGKHIVGGDKQMGFEAMLGKDDLETANDLEPVFKTSPADHVIHVGDQIKRIPGHEIKIEMELSPRLTALNKDPYWTYLYWVLPAQVPKGKWELKVKNLTTGQDYFKGINPQAGRWYIHLNQPEHRFNFELGIWTETGDFQTILLSNEIQAPPHQPSDRIDSDWATVEELYQGNFATLRGHREMGRAEGSAEYIMSRSKQDRH